MTLTLASILSLPLIGSGNFRNVYRDGETVYKIEYGEGIEYGSNRAEYANQEIIARLNLPRNVTFTPFTLLDVEGMPVISAPYIEGKVMGGCFCLPGEPHEGCLPPGLERDLDALGIDTAYGNVILSGDTYWLVDLDCDLY